MKGFFDSLYIGECLMDLKNITVEDLKEKFAAFDKKTLLNLELELDL